MTSFKLRNVFRSDTWNESLVAVLINKIEISGEKIGGKATCTGTGRNENTRYTHFTIDEAKGLLILPNISKL